MWGLAPDAVGVVERMVEVVAVHDSVLELVQVGESG